MLLAWGLRHQEAVSLEVHYAQQREDYGKIVDVNGKLGIPEPLLCLTGCDGLTAYRNGSVIPAYAAKMYSAMVFGSGIASPSSAKPAKCMRMAPERDSSSPPASTQPLRNQADPARVRYNRSRSSRTEQHTSFQPAPVSGYYFASSGPFHRWVAGNRHTPFLLRMLY